MSKDGETMKQDAAGEDANAGEPAVGVRRATAGVDESFRALADAMPQIVWITRPDGYHEYYNKHWWDYTGLTYEEARGEGWNLLLHPEDRPRAIETWGRCLASGEAYEIEYRFRRATDGAYRWFLGRALPQRDEGGAILKWFGTCTDIHDQKMAEQALRQAKEESEKVNRAKDQFLAMVSHELRTPLNAILGWTQLLQMDVLSDEERREAVLTIENNAKLQAQLVEDILDVSRIINHKLRLDRRPVGPHGVIRAAIDGVRSAAQAKRIRIVYEPRAIDALVLADAGRLQQVVSNLLTNAIKFSHEGGEVRVELDQVQSAARVTVSDDGIGIAPAFLPQVFERFQQADAEDRHRHGGLGLGLAIVRHLVEQHGGTVRADSEGLGKGATFTVLLPVAAVRTEAVSEPAADRPVPAGALSQVLKGVRVLVVDDEASARELVTLALTKHGADVEAVASVAEGLEKLPVVRPDVLVSDIAMPEVDGYQFITRVRELAEDQGGRVPAVALTAYASNDDRTRALAAGFDVHIAKPVETVELVAKVARLSAGAAAAG
jgi:PAS domain S-box-containing protein